MAPFPKPFPAEGLRSRKAETILQNALSSRILVLGDVMLDQFIWGSVSRISPEAPVPVVEFERESFMPGGAANVARNLTALGVKADLLGLVGKDPAAYTLRQLLTTYKIGCRGVVEAAGRPTCRKTRIVANQQQVVRIDRESRERMQPEALAEISKSLGRLVPKSDAVIVGDYGKGVVTQDLLDLLKRLCRAHGVWLSLDPKPVHKLDLANLSLITPNRKEAFELAQVADETRSSDPLQDKNLLLAASKLLEHQRPAILLITLGEQGMLLCQRDLRPFHIPTVAQEVFDVSGAGDTVIACFTLAITAGASPLEAAILSNHAAGIVVGKIGTATVTKAELLASFPG